MGCGTEWGMTHGLILLVANNTIFIYFQIVREFEHFTFLGRIQDAVSLAQSEEEPEAAARKLTDTAFARGSADNITCIVVKFHHDKTESPKTEPNLNAEPEPEPNPKAEMEPESNPNPEPEPESNPKDEPEPKPEAVSDPKPETEPETKAEKAGE